MDAKSIASDSNAAGSVTLLAIGPDPGNLRTILSPLSDQGFEIETVSGRTAEPLRASSTPPDLVLVLAGDDDETSVTVRGIRDQEGGSIAGLVVASLHPSSPEQRALWLAAGADDCLPLPPDAVEFPARLHALLGRHRSVREQAHRFRTLVEQSGAAIGYYDLEGRVVYFNKLALDYLGDEPLDSYRGRTLTEIFGREAGAEYGERIRRAAGSERVQSYEDRVELNGVERWYLSSYARIHDSDGRVAGVQIVSEEITKLKRTEAALLESRRTLEAAQEIARIGSWEYDIAANRPTWSSEMFRIFDLDAGKGEPDWEHHRSWIHPEDWPLIDHLVMRAIDDGEPYEALFRIIRGSGEVTWARTIGRAVRDPSGRIVRLVGTVQDVTELQEADAERQSLQDQLHQSRKLEAVGRLAGGVAHDFNNILTVILNTGKLVLERVPEGDSLREDLQEIDKAARRAVELTQQLLAFSRKQVIHPRVIDVVATVEALRPVLPRLIGEDIEIAVNASAPVRNVLFDSGQLDQILVNLAINARDAMPEGGRLAFEIRDVPGGGSSLAAGSHPDGHVLLTVTDTGVGMDRETLDNIFEPFFTTKELGRGTGLGLSTVYGIVNQHGGHIGVDSTPGGGTTVSIHLPATDRPVEAEETRRDEVVTGDAETVLLVEDDDSVRSVTERMLRSRGYEVISVEDPETAAELLREADPDVDLLLTDVVMPKISGQECHDMLTRIRPGLPVVFMSGYTEDVITRKGVLREGTTFISKPFTANELAVVLRTVLTAPATDPSRSR